MPRSSPSEIRDSADSSVWHAGCSSDGDRRRQGGALDHEPARCDEHRNKDPTMNMDVWYELRLREMSDLNEAANELLRDADEILRSPDDADDEQQ
jgi:hypothetical protein